LAHQSFHGLAHLLQSLVLAGETGITERKVQLFNVACARHVEHLLPNDLCRRTLELAEQVADIPELLSSPPLSTHLEIQAALDVYGPAPDFLQRPPLDPLTQEAYELAD